MARPRMSEQALMASKVIEELQKLVAMWGDLPVTAELAMEGVTNITAIDREGIEACAEPGCAATEIILD